MRRHLTNKDAQKEFIKDQVSFLKFADLYPDENSDFTLVIKNFDNIFEKALTRLSTLYSKNLKDKIMDRLYDVMKFYEEHYLMGFPIIIFTKDSVECFRIKQTFEPCFPNSLCLVIEVDHFKNDWSTFFKMMFRSQRTVQRKAFVLEIVFVVFLLFLFGVAFLK